MRPNTEVDARRARLVSLATLLAVVAFGNFASAATSSAPRLTGRTVVSGSASASLRVWLPGDATIADPLLDPRGGFTVTGPASVAGFVLREERTGGLVFTALQYSRLPAFMGGPLRLASASPDSLQGSSFKLRRGYYRLYLVTDGAPATVTIELKGLSGAARLTPRARASAVFSSAAPQTGPAPGPYSASSVNTFRSAGMLFEAYTRTYDVAVATRVSHCVHPGKTVATAPTCPGGTETRETTLIAAPPSGFEFTSFGDSYWPAGEYTASVHDLSAAIASNTNYSVMALTF